MSKAKTEMVPVEAPVAPETPKDTTILDGDFNELLNMEKERNQIESQLNQVSGAVFRLKQDQQTLFAMEKNKNAQLDQKRQEITKRYNLDPAKQWLIDPKTKKIVYSK